jgi:hypothetical protein
MGMSMYAAFTGNAKLARRKNASSRFMIVFSKVRKTFFPVGLQFPGRVLKIVEDRLKLQQIPFSD